MTDTHRHTHSHICTHMHMCTYGYVKVVSLATPQIYAKELIPFPALYRSQAKVGTVVCGTGAAEEVELIYVHVHVYLGLCNHLYTHMSRESNVYVFLYVSVCAWVSVCL